VPYPQEIALPVNKTSDQSQKTKSSSRKTIRGLKTVKHTLEKVRRIQKDTVKELHSACSKLKTIKSDKI